MEQKKWKFNVVDVIAVVLILAVVAFVGYKLTSRGGEEVGEVTMVELHYTVKCEGVDRELYESCKAYLPAQLMASGTLYDGQVNGVEMEPYYILDNSGNWVEDRDHVNLIFTVDATIPKTDVRTNEVAKQEIRMGKADYILKTEYMEFKESIITSVEWSE